MAEHIDLTLKSGSLMINTVHIRRSAMDAKGFKPERNEELIKSYNDLNEKNTAQAKALAISSEKTAEVNKIVLLATNLIKKLKNAIKSAFQDDKQKHSLFLIGETIPSSVKTLATKLHYYIDLLPDYSKILLENGMIQEEIDSFPTLYNSLLAASNEQEQANNAQVAATKARNASEKVLLKNISSIKSFAKVCFADSEEILTEFDSIGKVKAALKESEKITAEASAVNENNKVSQTVTVL
jgi:hypothetical protein